MHLNAARTQSFTNRIQAGAQDGSISGAERGQLRETRAGIKAHAAELKGNDGKLDAGEIAQLRAERNQLSGSIAQFRHN